MDLGEREQARGAPRLQHLPGLDGLRGLAVMAVVVFHAGHLDGGYLGVDLFFVLSGYLITSLLLQEATTSARIDLARFWGRRARRLLPALALMLLGVAAYSRFAAQPEELHRIRWDGLATLFYVANWRDVFAGNDYWALFTAPSPLEHTWSLAIEEQFYLVWPVVFAGVAVMVRRRRQSGRNRPTRATIVLAVALAGAATSVGLQVWLGATRGWNRVYFGTDTRAFALLIGAAVAALGAWRGPVRGRPARQSLEIAATISAVGLGLSWWLMSGSSWLAHHGGLAACSVAGAIIVAAVAHPRPGLVTRLVSVAPLRWMGLISYGMYLYHWPLMVWLSASRTGLSGPLLFAVQVSSTLAIATVSYRFVEQPIRHGSGWPPFKSVVIPAAGFVVVALALVGGTMTSTFRAVDLSDSALRATSGQSADFDGTTVMIIGDSVAFYLAHDGFEQVTTRQETRMVNLGVPGCQYPPAKLVIGWMGVKTKPTGPTTCDHGWDRAIDAYRPDYVIYVRAATDPFPILIGNTFAAPCTPTYQQSYRSLLRSDAARFAAKGATTVLVTNLPLDQDPRAPDADFASRVRNGVCGNEALRSVAKSDPANVRLVDLHAKLCPTPSTCRRTWNGVELRADRTHFKGRSARLVAAWILEQIGVPVESDN